MWPVLLYCCCSEAVEMKTRDSCLEAAKTSAICLPWVPAFVVLLLLFCPLLPILRGKIYTRPCQSFSWFCLVTFEARTLPDPHLRKFLQQAGHESCSTGMNMPNNYRLNRNIVLISMNIVHFPFVLFSSRQTAIFMDYAIWETVNSCYICTPLALLVCFHDFAIYYWHVLSSEPLPAGIMCFSSFQWLCVASAISGRKEAMSCLGPASFFL